MHTLPFMADGMVVRIDSFAHQRALGITAKFVRWAIAYKYPAERKTTILNDVEAQVGKTGKITPRAHLEPVLLAGTVVKHASLHNYGLVAAKGLRIGDTVIVEKAGEIIPQVIGFVEGSPRGKKKIPAPEVCPACGGPVEIERDDTEAETARRCVNPECPAQIREKLIWFAGRGQMDIDGLGEKTIDQIRESGKIPLDHFADVFRLAAHRDALLALDRMGEKKVDNLLAGVEAAKGRGLARVLAGMGIRYVGTATARALAEQFPNLTELLAAPLTALMPQAINSLSAKKRLELFGLTEKLADVYDTGLGITTAPIVYQYLHSTSAATTFANLESTGVLLTSSDFKPKTAQGSKLPFSGQTVVITGEIEGITRSELADLLRTLGAKVTSSVSAKTSFVIAGSSPGSKLADAQRLSVPVWNADRLNESLRQLGVKPITD
jgi:DNA ligase (NAD+)